MWPEDFCAPRISRRKEDCTRSVLKYVQSQDRAHHYVDDFACHLLGAEVCKPERCRPPAASCRHGANPAWSGQSGGREGTASPQGSTTKAERLAEAAQAEHLEEEPKKPARRICERGEPGGRSN